jgi:predicted MPP superfamily phosphohydrolase
MKHTKKILIIVIAGFLAICLVWGVAFEPNLLVIQKVTIHHPALAKVLGKKTVVQISDLHIPYLGPHEEKVLHALDQLHPDLLLLTGDYVRWNGNYPDALNFLGRLTAKDGIYAVMGDYDYSNSRRSCLFCHEAGSSEPPGKHNVHFLRNSYTPLNFDGNELLLVGFDRSGGGELPGLNSLFPAITPGSHSTKIMRLDGNVAGNSSLDRVPIKDYLLAHNPDSPVLVLGHNPLDFDSLPAEAGWVMLTGDTHGGQIPLPSFLWGLLGYQKNEKYNYGLFQNGANQMFVSRGVGTSHFKFRFFEPPEIVVLQFAE